MRWLHISDIHFGYNSATVNTMRKKLLVKARELEQVDCLFITGDLRYGKNARTEYPAETLTFISDLQKALKIKPEDTFVVPGNHDINRGDGALQAVVEAESNRYSTLNGKLGDDTLSFIKSKREPFLDLYQQIRGQEEPDWHYCIPKGEFNIICLNTALLCGRDGEDGSLIVGSELINKLSETVDSSKPGIVLAHHDFDALRQEEQQYLEIALKDMGAVLYLCGHKHVALSRLQNTYRKDQDLRVFLCGTSMDKDPTMSQTDMDFFVGHLDENGHSGWVQAYKWYPRSASWSQDIEFSLPQNDATDGIHYFPQDTRPRYEKSPKKEVCDRYCQYIRVQCGEIEQNGLPMNEEDVRRSYALRRIFVPLSFNKFSVQEDMDVNEFKMALPLNFKRNDAEIIQLNSLIPNNDCFRMFILSDPGGGKTTLLKWLASVYCFPDEFDATEAHLPKRELFPVWIRCRDIPEGSRPTIWGTIQNIALRGEWMPNGTDAKDFAALITHHINKGTLLLLIDGLDEIGIDADRELFVEQLRSFADNNPTVNIVVSSRPTGFSVVTQGTFPDFNCFKIAPLNKKEVKDLCIKWNMIVKADQKNAKRDAEKLAEHITGNVPIFRLASNPLLLTTLLLVERHVGRLPTKRANLYEEAIQVLLETWNRAGYEQYHPIDLDEAKYQLAYVAFHMMVNHEKQITKTELSRLLRNARRDLPEFVSGRESILEFIRHIEHRSALLIQKGYKRTETGRREQIYEFQHLTFQEYLAAYAVNVTCYPGAQENEDPITVITPHLTDSTMKEVVSLVAVRLSRFYPNKLVNAILAKLGENTFSSRERDHLRGLLLQFVADEVPVSPDMIDKIFEYCFETTIWFSDKELLRQILDGKNADKLKAYFQQVDNAYNDGYGNWSLLLSIMSGEIPNPYEYYKDNHRSESDWERAKAIMVLANAFWLNETDFKRSLNERDIDTLKLELYSLAFKEQNQYVLKSILTALRDAYFVKKSEEFSQYISVLARYINIAKKVPSLVSISSILGDSITVSAENNTKLSDEALQTILEEIEKKEVMTENDYGELLTVSLLALVHCSNDQNFSFTLSTLRKRREKIIELNPPMNDSLHRNDVKLFKVLRQLLLQYDHSEEKKLAVQEHILKTDLAWAQHKKRIDSHIFSYIDYSPIDGQPIFIPSPTVFLNDHLRGIDRFESNITYDDVIKHIHSQMKKIGLIMN